MTTDPDDDATASERLARAERDFADAADAYHALRRELNDLLVELRDGKTSRATRLRSIAGDVARAVGVLVREKERMDAARSGRPGAAGEASLELDLEAARDEVCGRLARLRAAGTDDGAA